MNAIVEDYGWKDSAPTCSAVYLIQPIIAELKRINAKRVLDLGCGNGAMSKLLHDAGFDVVGCDADKSGVEIAAKQFPNVPFHLASVYDDATQTLPVLGFDSVISTEVVEHLFEPRALPRFASQALKRGGSLIISTPYHGWLKNTLLSLLNKWDDHHNPMYDGGHIKFWSYATLSNLLHEGGFSVDRFIGAGRVPYLWKSMIVTAKKK
jgi:SAM-dependent methyltransferase